MTDLLNVKIDDRPQSLPYGPVVAAVIFVLILGFWSGGSSFVVGANVAMTGAFVVALEITTNGLRHIGAATFRHGRYRILLACLVCVLYFCGEFLMWCAGSGLAEKVVFVGIGLLWPCLSYAALFRWPANTRERRLASLAGNAAAIPTLLLLGGVQIVLLADAIFVAWHGEWSIDAMGGPIANVLDEPVLLLIGVSFAAISNYVNVDVDRSKSVARLLTQSAILAVVQIQFLVVACLICKEDVYRPENGVESWIGSFIWLHLAIACAVWTLFLSALGRMVARDES